MSQKSCKIFHRPKLNEPSILCAVREVADRRNFPALRSGVGACLRAIGKLKRLATFRQPAPQPNKALERDAPNSGVPLS